MSNLIPVINLDPYGTKNPEWATQTPNERLLTDPAYEKLVRAHMQINGVPGRANFFEVRVIESKNSLGMKNPWWGERDIMEKIFWVYSSPYYMTHEQTRQRYGSFFLEPYENVRVQRLFTQLCGYNPFPAEALIIPVECVQRCHFEMSGGYSDHIRHRPDPEDLKTAEEKEAEARLEERVKDIQKGAFDIPESHPIAHGDYPVEE